MLFLLDFLKGVLHESVWPRLISVLLGGFTLPQTREQHSRPSKNFLLAPLEQVQASIRRFKRQYTALTSRGHPVEVEIKPGMQ